MNKEMERMISKDLKMNVDEIRKSSWDELSQRPYEHKKAFRPGNMFLVRGNINLAQGRVMGTRLLNVRNTYRKALYELKCLMKPRKKQ